MCPSPYHPMIPSLWGLVVGLCLLINSISTSAVKTNGFPHVAKQINNKSIRIPISQGTF